MVHEKIGHMGVEKTFESLHRNYWFPSMREKICKFIRNCIRCIVYSAPVRASERTLYSIEKKPVPFDTLHLDHFGPLPSINSKRKHILLAVDAFTKMSKLYAVISTSAKEVMTCLEKYFQYYGRPRRIISDQGSCFTGLDFTAFLKKHNIEHVKIAVASPQANGQVERVNRTLKAILGKLSEPIDHANWVQMLPKVEFALNNTKHSSTKFTPSELLFGVLQRGIEVDELTEYLDAEFGGQETRDLNSMRKSALDSIEKSQAYNAAYLASKSTPAKEYVEGDFVVMRHIDVTPGVNKKLIPKFRGPYVVHKVLDNDRYVIRDIDNCQITQRPYDNVIEAARLRKWVEKKKDDTIKTGNEGNTTQPKLTD